VLEALAREVRADLRAAYAVVANEDGLARGVERRRPLAEEAQGQKARALDARHLVLLRLAHVNQKEVFAVPLPLGELLWRYRLETHAAKNYQPTGGKAKVKRQKREKEQRRPCH
jgi:hypothetical protein